MFPNLIALIYVAKVKIMASVRVTKGTSYVALSTPSPEAFVHQVYIECAHILYENPTLCHLPNNDVRLHFQRNDVLQDVVRRGAEEALSIMLPVKDILSEYLNNTMLENSVFSMGDEEPTKDKDEEEGDDEKDNEEEGDNGRDGDNGRGESETPRKFVDPVGDDFLKQALVRPLRNEERRVVHTGGPPTGPRRVEVPPPPPPHPAPSVQSMPDVANMPPPSEHPTHGQPYESDGERLPAGSEYFEDDSEEGDPQDYDA